MKNKILIALALAMLPAAYTLVAHKTGPAGISGDMRDAVADNSSTGEFDKLQGLKVSDIKPAEELPAPLPDKGYIAGPSPAGTRPAPIEWVAIPGGKFTMGTDEDAIGFKDARPVHEVAIKAFEMSRTLVTVEQYAECVFKVQCAQPATGDLCNWGVAGRQNYPINCVSWDQASRYAKFKGARLPSEAEWEYAATSGGKNQKYPWGNDKPTCDKVVKKDCGLPRTSKAVCSKPAGNTKMDGLSPDKQLCDMSGNVAQWVQDKYQDSYTGAPVDGGAVEGAGSRRVIRGGSYASFERELRADFRNSHSPGFYNATIGFRLAR